MRPTGINHTLRRVGLSAAAILVIAGSGLHTGTVQAQRGKNPPPMQQDSNMLPGTVDPAADPIHARLDEERVKVMNDDRRKRLSSDVDKLLSLTNELKSDVDKTNKDELSVEVIRKAQEIEKLAHDVQSRMKN